MFSRNAAIDAMRRSSNACAMAARSRRNIGPAGKMIEPASIVHRVKCATITLLVFDFDHGRLQAQLAGRLGGSFALLVRNSDEASARERLASDALYQGAH